MTTCQHIIYYNARREHVSFVRYNNVKQALYYFDCILITRPPVSGLFLEPPDDVEFP